MREINLTNTSLSRNKVISSNSTNRDGHRLINKKILSFHLLHVKTQIYEIVCHFI
jgi:hypothetical protein